MDYDQLAEYRKRHQTRYTAKDAAADEELARKLQVRIYPGRRTVEMANSYSQR